MKDCLGNRVSEGDFVIYVVQGDRNAGIEFGWILEITDKSKTVTDHNNVTSTRESYSVKIQRADPDGTRLNAQAVDISAHWRDDTPDHIKDYYSGYRRTREDYDQYYVDTTYRDTGKPSTTRLNCGAQEHRLLVTEPYV